MKNIVLALGLFASQVSFGETQLDPVEVQAPIEKIFIPAGFDDNDNVEVVLHGNFPDTCHQIGKAEAKINPLTKEVKVVATSFRYPGKFCIQSITPFIQTLSLGIMTEGKYKVELVNDKEVQNSLDISRRKTESPDDYLYATVENAYIEVNEQSGKQALKIQGHFPMFFVGCMVLKEVRAYRDPVDVLVVLPIADIVNDEQCDEQPSDRSFEYTQGLAETFKGEGLLHVRTLNGNSLNRFIDIQ